MLVKPFSTKLSQIADQVFLRCDPKYRHFWDNKKGISISQEKYPNVKIKDVLLAHQKTIIKKGPLEEERPLIELNDVEAKTSIILQERMVMEIGSDKLDFEDCDLAFNRLEPYLGKIVINDPSKNYIGTTEWIPLKINKDRISSLCLKYLLLLDEYLASYGLLKSGKRHARISQVDYKNMLIPLITGCNNILESEIKPEETKMLDLHSKLAKPIEIVNLKLSAEFNYDLNEYEKRRKQTPYTRSFSDFDKSIQLRNSVRFQHPKYDYLGEMIEKKPWVKLKTLVSEPIQRGVQPSYSEDAEVFVIKTANLKNDFIDVSEAQTVTKDFYESNKTVAGILKNDVLIASTGVGSIGKVDLYEYDEPAVADGHVSIVRLDTKKANARFITYYLRSILGYLQVERDYTGATNQIEIYPDQIEQMRIIDIDKKSQERIVKTIEKSLNELRKKKEDILHQRREIDRIILQELKP